MQVSANETLNSQHQLMIIGLLRSARNGHDHIDIARNLHNWSADVSKLIQRYRAYHDEVRVRRMHDREGELYGVLAVLGIEDQRYEEYRNSKSSFIEVMNALRTDLFVRD